MYKSLNHVFLQAAKKKCVCVRVCDEKGSPVLSLIIIFLRILRKIYTK